MQIQIWLWATAQVFLVVGLRIPSSPLSVSTPGPSPLSGENGALGGIFGLPVSPPSTTGFLGSVINSLNKGVTSIVPTSFGNFLNLSTIVYYFTLFIPSGSERPDDQWNTTEIYFPGTGPYPAHFITDPSLPYHVIYAPKSPPADNISMPVLLWANGACLAGGTSYALFLTEIASHGYIAIANGGPGSTLPSMNSSSTPISNGTTSMRPDGEQNITAGQPMTDSINWGIARVQDMLDAQEWVLQGNASQFGNVDVENFIAGGYSCGGLMAYSASYNNPRIKLIGVYNMALADPFKRRLLKELTAQVAYFQGGLLDPESYLAEYDYAALNESLPAYKASLNTGHMGTFFGKHGGKYANATVNLFNWVFRNDVAAMESWTNANSSGSLASQHWDVTYKNIKYQHNI